ncbi:MAG: efflux RND transporter permease subunit [Spirochaetia bacterium]|nr:efflux RND transporter permease subunit [Spirochaetia bacterium]
MSVSRLVVSRPVLFTIIFVVLTGLGLFFYADLPVEMMPEIEYPMITVITTYSGAAPESVEKSITKPIEEVLTSVTGVKELTSTSQEGRSRVMLEFDFGTNLDAATNDIRDKLDRVKRSLPDDADTPLIRIFNSSSMPIMRLAVRGDRDLGELRYIAENRIEDRLSQVEGVGDVSTYGGQVQAVQVELEQNRLDAYGITIASIKSSLSKQNMELGGGDIEGSTKEYLVRTTGEFKNVEEIAQAVVAVRGGTPIHLYDLGKVYMGHKDKTSIASVNGEPGVYVSIQRATGANIVQVADGLYKKIEELKDYLPEDINLIIIRDDSTEIRDTLSELKTTMLQGLCLVICVLFVFLRSVRSTVIISISLPVAVLITIFAMYLCGFTLNMMSMTGLILGLGMILDASIVVLENVYQHLDRGEVGKEAVIEGAHEMIAAITASTMTTVVVFLPFIFYKNQLEMVGQILTDVIFTIIISVSISLFVAIFLVPVLATKYFPVKTKRKAVKVEEGKQPRVPFVERFRNGYRGTMRFAIKFRYLIILLIIAAFCGGLYMLSKTRIIYMPGMVTNNITLSATLAPGTKLEETERFMLELEEIVKKEVKDYKYIITTSGSGTASYSGEISIELLSASERTETPDQVKDRLRKYFNKYPQAKLNFSSRRGGFSSTPTIKVQLAYEDINNVRAAAEEIMDLIRLNMADSVTNTVLDLTDGLPQVEVVIDRQRAYDFGLSVSEIAQEVRNSIEGTTATTYRESGNEYDVILRLQKSDRLQIPDLNKIFLISSSGKKIYLSNVASLKKGVGPMTISRDNKRRLATISVECSATAKMNEVQNNIKVLMDENMVFPDDVTYTFDGDWVDAKEKGKYVIIILTMAIILIFAVMAGQYESFKNPFINMFTIPLLVIGVAGIYYITGQSLSLFSAIGVVMLTGIVVNNGIVLVDYTNQLRAKGMSVYDACIEAAAARIRPILMTSTTTIFAMMPMAFSHKEGPNMTQPIALTVLGGLVSATLITLFFIPIMYYIFNKRADKKKQR